jgi:D-beta-D-heptose 7-phosphate kinase/D-beta-D-heptose 1-phosphate adenosyltransferase
MTTAVSIVRNFRHLRALVIGDAMLDTYFEGTAARLCSEGPVPVVRKTSERRLPGGAANTAANLRALEADVVFLGFTGRDTAGSLLRTALREQGVDDAFLVVDERASTLHKLRILADGQFVVRFDDETYSEYTDESKRRLLELLEEVYPSCDLVIVSDYCYGVIFDEMIERLCELRARHPGVLLVDSKDLYRFRNCGATIVTPNHLEARLLVEYQRGTKTPLAESGNTRAEMELVGRQLLSLIDAESAAITMAADGVFLIDRQGNTRHVPAHPVQQANVIGAGDSFAAALALSLASGASLDEAARIGIDAAAIAVAKRWTSLVHYQELLQRVSLRDHAEQDPETLSHKQRLERLKGALEKERAAGKTIVFTNGVFDILHAGHVHFLRQAKALGNILVVGVNSDRSVQRMKGKHRPINSERDRMALVAALDPVDYVVRFDEETPTELIRALRPHFHVKGGDYANEELPEAQTVEEVGGKVVILPLVGSISTSRVIDRILALAGDGDFVAQESATGQEPGRTELPHD